MALDDVAEVEDLPKTGEAKESDGREFSLESALESAFSLFGRRASGEDKPIGSPWTRLDEKMQGGFWPGLFTLTSNTGVGKTQWALQVALQAAQDGHEVVYVALELGVDELVARLLGLVSGVPWSKLYFGEKAALTPALGHVDQLKGLPITIVTPDATGWDYRKLVEVAERRKPRLLVLDYLQLVAKPSGEREDPRQTVGTVAKACRDLARRHGMTVLVLSSTARASYEAVEGGDPDGKPGTRKKGPGPGEGDAARLVGLGKESGEIEYTSDVSMVLVREKDSDDGERKRRVWLALAKGRGFGTGWVPLTFDGFRFDEAENTKSATLPTPKGGRF